MTTQLAAPLKCLLVKDSH